MIIPGASELREPFFKCLRLFFCHKPGATDQQSDLPMDGVHWNIEMWPSNTQKYYLRGGFLPWLNSAWPLLVNFGGMSLRMILDQKFLPLGGRDILFTTLYVQKIYIAISHQPPPRPLWAPKRTVQNNSRSVDFVFSLSLSEFLVTASLKGLYSPRFQDRAWPALHIGFLGQVKTDVFLCGPGGQIHAPLLGAPIGHSTFTVHD